MKIRKVETRAFAISERDEKRWVRKLKWGSIGHFIARHLFKEKSTVIRAYRPLVKLKLSRAEAVSKGGLSEKKIYETKENFMYVDLANADLYMLAGHNIVRKDILRKLVGVQGKSVRALGKLMREGFIYEEKIDPEVFSELSHLGYIEEYKSAALSLFKGLWDELNPEEQHETIVKERVKASINMPKFYLSCYDLSSQLRETDMAEEDYKRDNLKYSIEEISRLVTNLFDAKVGLVGVTFMPYLVATYESEGQHTLKSPEKHYPTLRLKSRGRAKPGVKLKPIALSTSISDPGAVPIEESTIDFSDVGGMESIKKELMEALIYPLKNPKLSKEFGKKSGGSILLYGPPGCGKSYLARATIGELGVPFFNVNISELVSKGVESVAENLHKVFEEARKSAPSVIFFDELDAIGGRRDTNMGHAEKMEIDQFLMEMDGVESLGKEVLILAATNAPWNIDPALRRSVRFTRHLFVPPPGIDAREQILKIHTRKMPLALEVDLREIAKLTVNYSASDLKAICDLALEIPWEEALEGKGTRTICFDDFTTAVRKQKSSLTPWFKMAYNELKTSGEEGIFDDFAGYILKFGGGIDEVKNPNLNFAGVGGMEDIKEEISKLIIYPLRNPILSSGFKKQVGGAMLLYGPPGCGKTYIARATAGECEVPFFNVGLTDIISDKPGQSERNIRQIFERAKRNAPAILFFDEVDAFTGRRDKVLKESDKRLIDAFLTEMDGFMEKEGLVVIAATNSPWSMDPALRRSGRFTRQIFVPPPDLDCRAAIFRIHLKDKTLSDDVDLAMLAEATLGMASSDIKAICEMAFEIPWGEALKGKPERRVQLSDFISVIEKHKSSLAVWYRSAERQIKEIGETDIYPELLESLVEFRDNLNMRKSLRCSVEHTHETLSSMKLELEDLKSALVSKKMVSDKIDQIKMDYHQNTIGEAEFSKVLGAYEQELSKLDVKIEILKEKSHPVG